MLQIAALVAFSFPGGHAATLASALETHYRQPVVIEVQSNHFQPKFGIKSDDPKDVRRLLAMRTGLVLPAVGSFALTERRLSPKFLGEWSSKNPSKVVGIDPKSLKDDQLTLRSKAGEVFSVYSLSALEWKKSVKIHQMFHSSEFVASMSGLSQSRALALVAKAIGARIEEKEKVIELEIDVSEYRLRLVRLYEKRALEAKPGIERSMRQAQTDVVREMLKEIPDSEIEKRLENPGQGMFMLSIRNGSSLDIAVGRYRRTLMAGRFAPEPDLSSTLKRIDFDRKPSAVFDGPASAHILWPMIGGGSVLH